MIFFLALISSRLDLCAVFSAVRQVECLNVLKAFMNNQYGLDVVVRMPAAIDALALLFESTNDRLRIQVCIHFFFNFLN
jgi:hypothetical protein